MNKRVEKKKKQSIIVKLFKGIYTILDRLFVTTISRFIFKITDKFKNNSNKIEKILNRPNILLYLSLIFAITMFFLVDREVINLVQNEAEVIANQPVKVLYNEEAYVVEFFNQNKICTLLEEHYQGIKNNGRKIYNIYVFLIWYKKFFIEMG